MKELAELVKTCFTDLLYLFWFLRYQIKVGTRLETTILDIHGSGMTTQAGSRDIFSLKTTLR